MRLDITWATKPGRWIYNDVGKGSGVGVGIQEDDGLRRLSATSSHSASLTGVSAILHA